ncbi:hypothetical protein SNOG_01069 [Parastagonospora nodorum SN15]|uniref:Uncharacterized protein n=1 Tax=Phaeosphaeria nodorum (strain SN15 / ATCC MYA-4574 / FGSC 10173) TaxID=321614 RepID=Q0V4J5_PHANO|nr:hypothetical protein SNOG_01069 [Parastagonospora nodorum SN15]EAT92564.1 hypothetical protein SNOG_01069 [Parastagonospora nodorum SN15]
MSRLSPGSTVEGQRCMMKSAWLVHAATTSVHPCEAVYKCRVICVFVIDWAVIVQLSPQQPYRYLGKTSCCMVGSEAGG